MDDILPSYGQATTRDYWQIISSFVRSQDLCAAALVSKEWNHIFIPHLWGNPASHFGTESDAVYVALVRFKRTLAWARRSTRELTHTLHLPPAQSELYDGPHAEWLYEILQRLPKLQSLIVSQLPFFDHGALSTLEKLSRPNAMNQSVSAIYSLRLLDASNCINVTSRALSAGLQLFPALMYLDLSGTVSAKHPTVLSNLSHNPCLQILKIQRLGLTDEDVRVLALTVGHNLRSLDVRDNRITDWGVRSLIENCVGKAPSQEAGRSDREIRRYSPSRPGFQILDVFHTERQDSYIRTNLTTGFVSYTGLEGAAGSGITHLYICGNTITVGGVADLLKTSRLNVLDVGSVLSSMRPNTDLSNSRKEGLLGAQTLTPVVQASGQELSYLRINHAVATQEVPAGQIAAEMEDSSTILFPSHAVELDSTEHSIHELPNSERQISELQGDIAFAELEGSPVPVGHQPTQKETVNSTQKIAPEPIPTLLSPVDATRGLSSPVSAKAPERHAPVETPTGASTLSVPVGRSRHKRSYSGVVDEHAAKLRLRLTQSHSLHPSMLPNMQTLVLTDVPQKAHSPEIASRLIQFITDCAEEAHWAKRQASLDYALPPGRDRRSAERQHARSLFPLQRLVLEMAPDLPTVNSTTGWRRGTNPTVAFSSVQDPDCEAFWAAAQNDFSFFGGEECGQPDTDGIRLPLIALTEKMTIAFDDLEHGNMQGPKALKAPLFEVLPEISKFRRAKKAQFQDAISRGLKDVFIDGFWDGEIIIIRPRR
ncbi:leucine rich repeat domain protein [Venturia nashicola]|uniref:Leucine rich repeat domain protein n=1 Tax=Venturia nashicola TaxID=86259 RepID=A0A4Z1PIG3_9PEZI|nr:leucine rich repeat domain protein [Venturia nashicola]TLD35831.1 leucine rich repeat domain protein [Venturia nashicola]